MKVKCKECPNTIELSGATESTTYLCAKHTRVAQSVFFQRHAFDKNLGSAVTGTVSYNDQIKPKPKSQHHTPATDELYK